MALARRDVDAPPPVPASQEMPHVEPGARAHEGEGWICCATCGEIVAESRAGVSVNGAHSHSFINPAGLIFRVRCFAAAPGVSAVGEESGHFTWFPGFTWRVAVCRACAEHLGWGFRQGSSSFVALIADRIVEQRAPDPPS